jgi:hypothetical protein
MAGVPMQLMVHLFVKQFWAATVSTSTALPFYGAAFQACSTCAACAESLAADFWGM